ncbi:MAG: AgmX/PglI C-terminal domain-containing protein [Candidatus Alcyoniella australis]|nr:AgmX/PglI C-terminal domain-containing protein [Candidatus Alcyoniella australis]
MKRVAIFIALLALLCAASPAMAMDEQASRRIIVRAIELSPVQIQRLFQGREQLIPQAIQQSTAIAVDAQFDPNDLFDMATIHADLSDDASIEATLRELIELTGMLYATVNHQHNERYDSLFAQAAPTYPIRFDGYHTFNDYTLIIEKTESFLRVHDSAVQAYLESPERGGGEQAAQSACVIQNALANITADLWVTVLLPLIDQLDAPLQTGTIVKGRRPPVQIPDVELYLPKGIDPSVATAPNRDLPIYLEVTNYGTSVAADYSGPTITIDEEGLVITVERLAPEQALQQAAQARREAALGLGQSTSAANATGVQVEQRIEQQRALDQAAQARREAAISVGKSPAPTAGLIGTRISRELENRSALMRAQRIRTAAALALDRGKGSAVQALAAAVLVRRNTQIEAGRELRLQSIALHKGEISGVSSTIEGISNSMTLEVRISGSEVQSVQIDESKLAHVRGVQPDVDAGNNDLFSVLESMDIGTLVNADNQRQLKQGENGDAEAEQSDIDPGLRLDADAPNIGEEKSMLTVSSGSLSVDRGAQQGTFDAQAVSQILADNHRGFSYCYETQLKHSPNLSGKIAVEFTIGLDGRVDRAVVLDDESDLKDSAVQNCILERFKRLKFPPPVGGEVTVKYPLIFAPSFSF